MHGRQLVAVARDAAEQDVDGLLQPAQAQEGKDRHLLGLRVPAERWHRNLTSIADQKRNCPTLLTVNLEHSVRTQCGNVPRIEVAERSFISIETS